MSRIRAQRGQKAHVSGSHKPITIDWAMPEQEEIFSYGPYPQCASGGFGSSKTFAFCLKAIWLSQTFPGNRGVIFRKVHTELVKTTMATFFKICPPSLYDKGRRSDSEKILVFNNGSEILWMHLEDPEIANVIRGLEINWFFGDQAEEIDEEVFDLLCSRLGRWDKAVVPDEIVEQFGGIANYPWINPANNKPLVPVYPMIACNPDTELHWIYRRFHEESPDHDKKQFYDEEADEWYSYKDMGYKMWNLDSRKNKFLPKQNLAMMLAQDESFVRRFVRGEWGLPEGQIHYVDRLSIIEGSHELEGWIIRNCKLYRLFDHGDAAPACCLWMGVDHDGNLFFYREYYKENALISEHRKNIYQLSKGEKYADSIADPSIFNKTQQNKNRRYAVADEYADCRNQPRETAIFWTPGDNDELGTRNRINEYLRVDPERVNPVTRQRGSPRMFFLKKNANYPNGCEESIYQLRSQRRVKIGSNLGRPIFCDDRDEDIPDHAYDPIRYGVASRPASAAKKPDFKKPGKTFNQVASEFDLYMERGGYRMDARLARLRYRALRRTS